MKFSILEIIFFITAFQLIIFSCFLFTKRPIKTSNIILGIFLLAQVIVIVNNLFYSDYFIKNYPFIPFIGVPFCLVWGPAFYLYVKFLAFSNTKFKLNYLLHFIPSFLDIFYLIITFCLYTTDTLQMIISSSSFRFIHYYFLSFFIMLQILVYNILSLRLLYYYHKKLKENFSSISKINFSWLSVVIIGYTIAHIISTTIQMITFSAGYNLYLRIILFTIFLVFFNIIFFKAWQQPEIFSVLEENIKYKSSKLTKSEAENWIEKLKKIINTTKPFLNPGLTINQLAEEMEISPRMLSQIINEYYNQNFYDYINRLRIEESKIMLTDSSNKKTVLEILYDVGFNSKTAFNIAFKKTTGITPTEFRKQARKEACSIES